jgi:hypothetical protein
MYMTLLKASSWEKMASFFLNSMIIRAKLPESGKAYASKAYTFLDFISDLTLGELAGVFIKPLVGRILAASYASTQDS